VQPVWYHLYPLGFLGAEGARTDDQPVEHRLRRLEAWLPHVVALGCTHLQLGPVFESETHGYDTTDHFRVDPRLGDEDDLVAVFDACHRAGLRVVLDGVFNHVGRSFRAPPDWYRRRGGEPVTFEGHDILVTLDHAAPEVLDHAVAVARYWLERGADAWRLDAAYAVPTAFWRGFSDRVRAAHPAVELYGEVIHGDYVEFVAESGFDGVTQYELWKAIWSSLNDGNPFELSWALQRHAEFCRAFRPLTFVGNHDTTRIASQLADPRRLPLALVILFTVPGTPVIYAGDERGLTGVKRDEEGGDDEVRPRFPDDPSELGGDPGIEALTRSLIAARPQGELELVETTNERLVYRVGSTLVELDYDAGEYRITPPALGSATPPAAGSATPP
jgi:cyclomaltodextrinase